MSERSSLRARRATGLAASAVAVLSLSALPAAAPASAAAASVTVTVSGTVTESGTESPLAGRCVRPYMWFTDAACTDAELTDAKGRYERTFSVPGGQGKSGSLWVEPDEYHVSSKANLKITDATSYTLNLTLAPVGTLTGRAVDADGEPVKGACPQLRGVTPAGPLSSVVSTCSDADGTWTLAKVPPSNVAVALLGTDTLQASYVPKASRIDLARHYDVVAGTTASLPETVLLPGAAITVHTDLVGRGSNIITLRPTKRTQDLVPGDRAMTGEESNKGDGINPTLTNVQAGEYLVLVENVWASDDCYGDDPICSSFAPWWAPGVVDAGRAKPVKLAAGDSIELTAAMKPYRSLQLTFPDLPARSVVTVQAYFPSGKAYTLPLDVELNASGNATAAYLPPSEVKLKFITEPEAGGRKVWWYGGKNFKDSKLVPLSKTSLRVPGPGAGTS